MPIVVERESYPQEGIGLPDYSQPKPVGQVPVGPTYTSSDVAELAARLGSIVTFDRRGNVVVFDDFEEPFIRWNWSVGGHVGEWYLDSTSVRSGSQSLYIATGPALNAFRTMYKKFSVLRSKRLGMELSFSKLVGAIYFYYFMHYYDGETLHRGRVRIDPNLLDLYIESPQDNWVKIDDLKAQEDVAHLFLTTKLVCDFETDKYVRLLFGPEEYNIEAYPLVTYPAVTAPGMETHIKLENKYATYGRGWIEDFIFTQAEP